MSPGAGPRTWHSLGLVLEPMATAVEEAVLGAAATTPVFLGPMTATQHRAEMITRFAIWDQITGVTGRSVAA